MREFDFIDRIRHRIGPRDDVPVGPGDDAALARFGMCPGLLYTVDMLMDGVHFRVAECGPYAAGRKAMAVNLSDVAAMGGRAVGALVSLALPRGKGAAWAEPLFAGLADMADRFGVAIIGGDTNSWDGELVASVTVIGVPHAKGPVRRNGARPGDEVFVTGPLGGSLAGHHLSFTPRLAEAEIIMRHVTPTAMIDVSDGMSSDAAHVARESGVRMVLHPEALPLTAEARRDADPVGRALHDGEDFELLLTLSPADAARWRAAPPAGVTLHPIGRVEAGQGLFLEDAAGKLTPLAKAGFEHTF